MAAVVEKKIKKILYHCKFVQAYGELFGNFLKKLKIKLPFDPTVPLLGLHPKSLKPICQKNVCIPIFMKTLGLRAKIWN